MTFHRAVLPHYVCGFWVQAGRIVDSAPIMTSWRGRTLEAFTAWARSKGGMVEEMGLG